ncbi:hybrid sensor histidine kinase/response regulator [Novosphingobium sp. PC22D]|uniref:hybrid sensor histidine kinase/response regulator n=1 Tax=Novosphingobium sp. PC22D TaxID=1962403 RepID=UPI000BF1D48C|nr:PAS domain-containing sensor histidine kinase [Novosphingobium sp. PC22D]PEQ13149.1 hybrid sensor histidine kinase/response regulator [Novosphingobium sp. PC22D]
MSIEGDARREWTDWLGIAAALAASTGLVWLASRDPVLTAVFTGGLLVFVVVFATMALRRAVETAQDFAMPDWSVTVAAIERPDTAVAVADRAGRLVCANARYREWLGAAHAPPRAAPGDAAGGGVGEALANAARAAWRDGRATIESLDSPVADGPSLWRVEVERAGRGEDHLIWRFVPDTADDPVAELVRRLDGKAGRTLAKAGISAALVDPDGIIRAASAGFAERATGDPFIDTTGQEFVSLLHQDEDGRIAWASEGEGGPLLTLYYIPIADPDTGKDPDPETTPSLLLVADAGIGVGGGNDQGAAAVPHLESMLGQLPLGLAMANRDGRLLFANPAFMRAAGREGQVPPTYPTDLVVREDKRALSEAVRRFGQGPATAGDIAIRLNAQPDDPVSLSLAGVRGLGEPAVLLGLTDTSEETRLRRQVAQATKMQAVGQLAGGVAHDFNNVLTAIMGTCDLMLMRHTPGDSDYDDIQQIRANSNRAAALTRQLLAFSRQQTLRPEVIQLPDIVSETSHMLKRLVGERIRFEVTHDRDLGSVRADPQQLGQVIMNLVVNARDAIHARGDGKGHIAIRTRRVSVAEVRAMRSEIIPAGEYTALVVEDDGGGIPPEHLGKIFEPFFTTKEQGKGTGLGLSTVYGIVKQSGGFIFADSEAGKGTRFTVYLPVFHVPSGSAPSAPVAEVRHEWAGGGRILLVEDEDPVRLIAERALSRQGYEVVAARDGEEGLDHVANGGVFDLVVSDVVMPSMDGPTMAREIRKVAPAMPLLFMSGYAEEQLRKEIGIERAWFMPKPFSVQQLSEKVGEVLALSAE